MKRNPWPGAWCWQRLAPLLSARGHGVITPDLPGHGDDPTPLGAVNLDAYADHLAGIAAAAPEPPVIVGHSMAGIVLSTVAERIPDRIRRLVYLSAYMLRDGQTLSAVAKADSASLVEARVGDVDGIPCVVLKDGVLRRAFYHDATDHDLEWVSGHMAPQPVAPFRDAITLTSEKWGGVPRLYVHCADDRAISRTLQRQMVAALPGTATASLAGGHSPFITRPQELAALLDDL